MTRKLQDPVVDDARSRKRILKPAVEKKRRDRINKSLAELRALLLRYTADPRLQNPKIEKAEILDLAVEYLHMWTDGKNLSNDAASGVVNPHCAETSAAFRLPIESAGFQQCMAQLASYMQRITPAQRRSLIEGLKHHGDGQQLNSTLGAQHSSSHSNSSQSMAGIPGAASGDAICTSESKEHSCRFSSHTPPQPHSCSTPCHDILTPPTSPWLSPSFSTYASSPPFPSFACHFSFPPSLSPPSSNTSFSMLPQSLHTLPTPISFSPGLAAIHFPPVTLLRPPPRAALMEGSSHSSVMWRPWS